MISPGSSPAYFVDTKKGEVSELKALLKNINVEKDAKRKRDIIKKVIAYMTLGIDVSRLFTEMMMAIETKDLVVKKMVYFYLCNYAHGNPDLALMCVNTLQRDCSSSDPMVRGLALRSLTSLRLPSMVEYISEPLRKALTDISAYVRKTGVMGILKLYHLSPEMVKNSNMIDLLYDMIQDVDTSVVYNCVLVLNEILAEEGGMAINQAIIHHMLKKVNEFNEWGLIEVLKLTSKYTPETEDEMFDIMNLLDPVLKTSYSGVVLAAIKCFIHLTEKLPDFHWQVYTRMKAPLLTLMNGGTPEIEYCILKHIEHMSIQCPGVYDDEYRQFYVRYNEPTYCKYVKIDILALVACEDNVMNILSELSEYATEISVEISRRAIRAISKIAFKLPATSSTVFERFIEFLEIDVESVRGETIEVMKDLLRRYPNRRQDIMPSLNRCLKLCDEARAKASVIWMIGEYGGDLETARDAPYMLEPLIDSYTDLETTLSGAGSVNVIASVKINLLTATMKLFFKRPPEMQSMLGRLLAEAVNDVSSQDLHDRALLYYRLLKQDVNLARDVVLSSNTVFDESNPSKIMESGKFAEEEDTSLRDKVYKEFNTLSILYEQLSSTFVSANYQVKIVEEETTVNPQQQESESYLLDGNDNYGGSSELQSPSPNGNVDTYQAPESLIDMNDDFLYGSSSEPQEQNQQVGGITFVPNFSLDAPTFQSSWNQFEEIGSYNVGIKTIPDKNTLEGTLRQINFFTLASGDLPDSMKLFLYCKDNFNSIYLIQAIVQKQKYEIEVVVKMKKTHEYSADPAEGLLDTMSSALSSIGMM